MCHQSRGMILIYLLTEIGLSPSGSSTVHIYTQIHKTTKITTEQHKWQLNLRQTKTKGAKNYPVFLIDK